VPVDHHFSKFDEAQIL